MTQSTNFKSLPAEVKEKIAALEHHKQEINRLNERLEISKQEVERLETELYLYRASVAPIGKCPLEILAAIFKAYLEENPRLIRRLLLVSKQWHGLAINTPGLWTNIPIYVDSSLAEAKDAAESIKPRLYACLRHSKDLLLHIDFNLEKMVLPSTYINDRESEFQKKYLGNANVSMLQKLWMAWEEYEDKFKYLSWNSFYICELIPILVGSEKQNMRKWESLKIRFPSGAYDNDTFPILERLIGPTPNLTCLFIQSPLGLEIPDGVTFTDLSSLRHLGIRGSDYLRTLGGASIKKLHHLETVFRDNQLLQKFSKNSLRSLLSLVLRTDVAYTALPDPIDVSVHLPLLHSLSFTGGCTRLQDVRFELPALRNLYIERGGPNYFIEPPNVNPRSVTWRIMPDHLYYWKDEEKRVALRKLILQYTSAETLIVDEAVKEDLDAVVEKLREEGYSSISLERIQVGSVGDIGDLLGFTE